MLFKIFIEFDKHSTKEYFESHLYIYIFWYVGDFTLSRRSTERIETLNGRCMVRRFLITVNWPRSKLRLTGHGQDIFSPKFYHRVQIHCSRRPALNGDRESWKTPLWETVFSGQGGEIVTKGTVSIINRATRVNAHRSNWIEEGKGRGKKRGEKNFATRFDSSFKLLFRFFYQRFPRPRVKNARSRRIHSSFQF